MASPLKDLYSSAFMQNLVEKLDSILTPFNKEQFIESVFDKNWESKELKERGKHIASVLKVHLATTYPEALDQLMDLARLYKQEPQSKQTSLPLLFLPEFIETNGLDDFDRSIEAMEELTELISCEFAVRPFFVQDREKMVRIANHWTKSDNEHVRRLASEGSRSRLPWGMALKEFQNDPSPLFTILETLKEDPSDYVRRSVANNLNDIAKDHPHIVIDIAKHWYGNNKETNWIVKHACRTLLKQGNREVMTLFGFGLPENISINAFQLQYEKVKMGGDLIFQFILKNQNNEEKKLRLEYAMHYLKKSGKHTQKVFKISEKIDSANSETNISRKQSFRAISTRVYYPGLHKVELLINGESMGSLDFTLLEA